MDKEGQEIYEDDIISFDDGKIGVVEFFRGCFVARFGKNKAIRSLYEINNWSLKILGNRFENPELIDERTVSKKLDETIQISESMTYERSE